MWKVRLPSAGVGGLLAASGMVVAGSRDPADKKDRFSAFDLATGQPLWAHEYEAEAELDYGNSPRATPALAEGVVVTQGATGRLSALDAATGVAPVGR